MSLTRAERTTTINYDDAGDHADIVTYSVSLINSLRKNGSAKEVQQYPEGGVRFRIPKKLISVRNARKGTGRQWTAEQRAAAAERMRKARAAKTKGNLWQKLKGIVGGGTNSPTRRRVKHDLGRGRLPLLRQCRTLLA